MSIAFSYRLTKNKINNNLQIKTDQNLVAHIKQKYIIIIINNCFINNYIYKFKTQLNFIFATILLINFNFLIKLVYYFKSIRLLINFPTFRVQIYLIQANFLIRGFH